MLAQKVVLGSVALSMITLLACVFIIIVICSDVSAMWHQVDSEMASFKILTDDLWKDMVGLGAVSYSKRRRRQSTYEYGLTNGPPEVTEGGAKGYRTSGRDQLFMVSPSADNGGYSVYGIPGSVGGESLNNEAHGNGQKQKGGSNRIQWTEESRVTFGREPSKETTNGEDAISRPPFQENPIPLRVPSSDQNPEKGSTVFSPVSSVGGAVCNCNLENHCPPGPPGPKGEKGIDGMDGLPGKPGIDAPNAVDLKPTGSSGCFVCPAGQMGPTGPPGPRGIRGMRGAKGSPGMPGRAGAPGAPGDMGSYGPIGPDGEAGVPGENGTDTEKIVGRKGSRGPPGDQGPEGPRGEKGDDAPPGEPGPPGVRGMPGFQGPLGADGAEGAAGPPGKPGKDAKYCKCPPRKVKSVGHRWSSKKQANEEADKVNNHETQNYVKPDGGEYTKTSETNDYESPLVGTEGFRRLKIMKI